MEENLVVNCGLIAAPIDRRPVVGKVRGSSLDGARHLPSPRPWIHGTGDAVLGLALLSPW